MKLNFQQIKSITVGAVDIWEENGAIRFSKCTKSQLEQWKVVAPSLINNVLATTGVRLDFHTDATYLECCVAMGGKYEIKINDVLTHQFILSGETDDNRFRVALPINGKMNRVVVSLPSHKYSGAFYSVELSKNAKIERHVFDRKILFLGDSLTQGYNARFDLLSFAYLISDFFNAESVVQGIGGTCFEPTTALDIGFEADIVFVAYGTNDFTRYQTLQELEIQAEKYLSKWKTVYPNATFFLISPIWRQDAEEEKPMGTFSKCCEAIKKVAQDLAVTLIDGDKIMAQLPDFMADTIHPNDLGFTLYAINVLKEVYKKIK
jgi:lysophospholipase L1-like esterase